MWLAPLIAVESSELFQKHPGWFIRKSNGNFVSAGFNWGEPVYALDTTHPDALAWLANLMKQVRAWGFDYIKLDFLYAGALPGVRHVEMPREAAYRHGLTVIREALGEAFFLTCGAPILPSLGLCDAMRVGPDVSASWEDRRDAVLLYNPTTPGARNAIRTTINRLWLKPLVQTDPDVAYFRSRECALTPEQRQLLQDLATICDFKATSDLPQWLSGEERQQLDGFLRAETNVTRTGRAAFMIENRPVDFSPAMDMPEPPRGLARIEAAVIGWLGSQGWALKILDGLGKRDLAKMVMNIKEER